MDLHTFSSTDVSVKYGGGQALGANNSDTSKETRGKKCPRRKWAPEHGK